MRASALDFGRMRVEHDREAEESERLRQHAREVADRARKVAERVNYVNDLYRERLVGVRRPARRERT